MEQKQQEKQEMTPEQYAVQVLKQRFAERTVQLEEIISNLMTEREMMRQEISSLKDAANEKEAKPEAEESD